MSNEKRNNGYVVIGSKTSSQFAMTFNRICRKKGIKPYKAMQMMVDSFVRYTDDQHNLSEEMERLMSVFEHMAGWKEAFNLAEVNVDRQIDEAVYFLTSPERKGARAIMVHRPYFGNWTETANVQSILERVIELLIPEQYRRLRALAVDMDCNSILELINRMVDAHTLEQFNAELRKDFEDCNRSEYGKPIEYGERTKRKHRKGVDMFEQQPIKFTEVDKQTAAEEAGREMEEDFRPFGQEW
jgi:hypothetical protein